MGSPRNKVACLRLPSKKFTKDGVLPPPELPKRICVLAFEVSSSVELLPMISPPNLKECLPLRTETWSRNSITPSGPMILGQPVPIQLPPGWHKSPEFGCPARRNKADW